MSVLFSPDKVNVLNDKKEKYQRKHEISVGISGMEYAVYKTVFDHVKDFLKTQACYYHAASYCDGIVKKHGTEQPILQNDIAESKYRNG